MIELGTDGFALADFVAVAAGAPLGLRPAARTAIGDAAAALDELLAAGLQLYGITTGYGAAAGAPIPPDRRAAFQLGMIRSHACGTGPPLDRRAARGMWIAKLSAIATGRTGASLALADHLVAVLNAGLAPAVPEIGSLGASGDLVPSGHAALALVGEGDLLEGPAATVGEQHGIHAFTLGPRDGLSLVNGTAATLAIGALAVADAALLLEHADAIAAAGIEASRGHVDAFAPGVAGARHHPGAAASAAGVLGGLTGADLGALAARGLHDPYAWRCVPAVHGAARDAHAVAAVAIGHELRGCSDNPLIDRGPDGAARVRSGGNFHGAPLGLPLDHLTRALGVVAAMSSRRVGQLLSGSRGAPAGLAGVDGANGLTQLLATSLAIVLEIQGLAAATPNWLPVDAAEDHTSNATSAARQARRAGSLLADALAIEAIAVAAHADLAGVTPRGTALREYHARVRAHLAPPGDDVRTDRAIAAMSRQMTTWSVHAAHA